MGVGNGVVVGVAPFGVTVSVVVVGDSVGAGIGDRSVGDGGSVGTLVVAGALAEGVGVSTSGSGAAPQAAKTATKLIAISAVKTWRCQRGFLFVSEGA